MKETKWISVEDILPTENKYYLVYSPKKKIGRELKQQIKVCIFRNKKFYIGYSYEINATHWMQLPNLPEEK